MDHRAYLLRTQGGPEVVHDARVGGPLLRAVVEQVERGELTPNIDAVYTLEQTIDAHRRMAADEATGKLIVLPRALPA